MLSRWVRIPVCSGSRVPVGTEEDPSALLRQKRDHDVAQPQGIAPAIHIVEGLLGHAPCAFPEEFHQVASTLLVPFTVRGTMPDLALGSQVAERALTVECGRSAAREERQPGERACLPHQGDQCEVAE